MSYPWGRTQLINDLASHTINEYYDPAASNVRIPHEGYMIPVTPERRLTSSPTGGVRARYLAKNATSRRPPPWPYTMTAGLAEPPLAPTDSNPTTANPVTAAAAVSRADLTFLVQQDAHPSHAIDMSTLISAHASRPGEHILRIDTSTGQLYACIPAAPAPPRPLLSQHRHRQQKQPQQQKSRDHRRGRNRCDHCASPPTRILHARRLCGFHAVYVATGRYVTRYEAAALAELDDAELGPGYGWSVEETAEFVEALGRRMEHLLLVMGSEEEGGKEEEGAELGAGSPGRWGAVGDGRLVKGKGEEVGLRMESRVSERSARGMGPRIYQVYLEGLKGAKW
ncbi:hypothetical protein QBC33DRAFT_386252 [Phialemonium atrogriseum]|uniref:Uncharacterized protein n=1 Tax=Phialemonium atrogriseum TaxID=1093897 RepID=A0AAJ0C1Y7_9PEZI|nr:uncharacterized protein QBC33DRAFT_386252 [Phialemonium atrogriseum]KAK1768654.1 hypothetical protein QBC33DRAFT_386252 [Phialemonium atrogriseum]